MERALSAAGKLFLSGEYAVLWGGVARVAAVGPRTHAHVRRRGDGGVHLVLEEGLLRGRTTPKGVHWERPVPPGYAFAARALDEVLRVHGRECLGFELAISPSAVGTGGEKLGLGGSACATVLAAEAGRFILEERFDALKLALVSHSTGQGGKGSGGDVAASFAGGLLRYRRYDVAALAEASATGRYRAALLAAPPVDIWRLAAPRVSLVYAFTGQSASTKSLIREVEARLPEQGRRDFVVRSDVLGSEIERGLGGEDFASFSEAVRAQHRLLAELGPVETEEIRRVLALASTYGCAGKVSGAGGGDGCILFAPDPDARRGLLEGLAVRGLHALPLEPEPGLRGEAQADATLRGWLDAHA